MRGLKMLLEKYFQGNDLSCYFKKKKQEDLNYIVHSMSYFIVRCYDSYVHEYWLC